MRALKFVAYSALMLGLLNGGKVVAQSFSSSAYSGKTATTADDFWAKGSSSDSATQSESTASFFESGTGTTRATGVGGTSSQNNRSFSNTRSTAVSADDFWSKKTSTASSANVSENNSAATSNSADQPWKTNAQMFAKPQSTDSASENADVSSENNTPKEVETKPKQPDYVNAGLPWNETLDGSKRGKIGLYQKGANFSKDNSFIFIYYDDFSVNRSLGGEVRCNMRFVVTSTLDRKINNLSVQLVWPKIETALNFYDVIPNTDTYFYYTLMGEGCYSMDKIPNIVVNRCRVSKMSAKDCASKIRWLRKG